MAKHVFNLEPGVQVLVEASLIKMESAVKKQILEEDESEAKTQRYREGSRVGAIDWRRGVVLRTALAIGFTAYVFYWKSCVKSDKQTSEAHTAHRVTGAEFARRVVQYVHLVYPKFTELYGHELDGLEGETASLPKKMYNVGLYAEFERLDTDREEMAELYAHAVRLLLVTPEILRECNITPVTANGESRRTK